MSIVRQAVIYSFASRYVLQLISLVTTMLVARLLTPAEIGTFAIASAIVMVISEFRLLGAGSYLVREKEIPVTKIRSALGLTFLISWGAGFSIFISAPYIADFYKLPEVSILFRILSISFLIGPFISIPSALLQREYDFKTLFRIALLSNIVGFIATIGLILAQFSFYALALGQIIRVVTEFLLVLWFCRRNMVWMPSFSGLKPIASFGIFTSLAGLFRKAHVTVPDMVIGRMGNNIQVAMYSRGLGLVDFISQTLMASVNSVALPYLSEAKRSGKDIASAYTQASVLLGGIVCPVLAVAGVASVPTIRLFFGDQWDEAAPLASWLAVWGMLRCVHWLSVMVLMAHGAEKIMLFKEGAILFCLVMGVILSYPSGLESVAISFVGVGLVDVVLTSVVLRRTIKLDLLSFLIAWSGCAGVTGVCAGVTFLLDQVVDFNHADYWRPILLIALVLPVAWLLSLKLFRHPLNLEIERIWRSKVKRR